MLLLLLIEISKVHQQKTKHTTFIKIGGKTINAKYLNRNAIPCDTLAFFKGLVNADTTFFIQNNLPRGVLNLFNFASSILACGKFSSNSFLTPSCFNLIGFRFRVILLTSASEDFTQAVIVEKRGIWVEFIMYI